MIALGKSLREKEKILLRLLEEYEDVDRVFIFHGDTEPPKFELPVPIYTVDKHECQMYRTFYPLLGQPYQGREEVPAITPKSLLVCDEMLQTTNRSDLDYNCCHHFLRVSNRHVVFNYWPIISDQKDFMILMDFDKPDRYKGKGFHRMYLDDVDITPHKIEVGVIPIEVTPKQKEAYESKKDSLFENLGMKDPDTIPRALELLAGGFKKRAIKDGTYVARNGRIKRPNVFTYDTAPEAEVLTLIDVHYSAKKILAMLRSTGAKELIFIQTDLPVDSVYLDQLTDLLDKVEEFYE